jgi:predicted PurR-regulated permease PerM
MCVQCAMVAAAGATGVRTWLQNHGMAWLTPRRLRAITVALVAVAFIVPSFALSGSSKPHHSAPQQTPASAVR